MWADWTAESVLTGKNISTGRIHMKRLVVIKASRMKWLWLLLKSNSFNKWNLWQIWDAGVDLGVMNYGVGHMSGMCLMWLWVKWLWPCLDDLGTGGVSSFTLWLRRWWAFKQPHGAPTALLPPFGVSMRGHCVPRVGRSVTEARGQGSVVVVSAEQEASAATWLQYASYTSTCQFILWTDSTKTLWSDTVLIRKQSITCQFLVPKVKMCLYLSLPHLNCPDIKLQHSSHCSPRMTCRKHTTASVKMINESFKMAGLFPCSLSD